MTIEFWYHLLEAEFLTFIFQYYRIVSDRFREGEQFIFTPPPPSSLSFNFSPANF